MTHLTPFGKRDKTAVKSDNALVCEAVAQMKPERSDLLTSTDKNCINCFEPRCKCDCDEWNCMTQFATENRHLCDCDECRQ